MGARAPMRSTVSRLSASIFLAFFSHFPGCFPVVAALAQALVVSRIYEQLPVSTVRLHVVHHGSPGTDAPPGALAAERLPQELSGTEVVRPEGQAVPAVVLRRCTPGRFFRLVSWAVPIPGQFPASWMSAGTERLHGHGLSPPGKTKSQRPTLTLIRLSGTGYHRALAILDIDFDF